jgi:Fur family zinc uptake transcriptional regulator
MAADVQQLLDSAKVPLSALNIKELLDRKGQSLATSLVFRALRALTRLGRAKKIHLAHTYVRSCEADTIFLVCESCGAVQPRQVESLYAKIGAMAEQNNFKTSEIICELSGRCNMCALDEFGGERERAQR